MRNTQHDHGSQKGHRLPHPQPLLNTIDPMLSSPWNYEMKREDYLDSDTTDMTRSLSWDSSAYTGSTSPMSSTNSYLDPNESYLTLNGLQGGGYPQQSVAGSSSQGYPRYLNMGDSTQMGFSQAEHRPAERKYVCLHPGCPAKPFGRSADLERHLKQVHAEEDDKEKFYCDYRRCLRKEGSFGRKDHFRDHFRDYHKEDMLQRGKPVSKDWWDGRNINTQWWRCNKCLQRIEVAKHAYECPDCRFLCETERQRHRAQRIRKEQEQQQQQQQARR